MNRVSTASQKSGSTIRSLTARSVASTKSSLKSRERESDPFPKPPEWHHVCPCDDSKPKELLSVSTQCLCEEVDFEKELILYFRDAILRSVFINEYNTKDRERMLSRILNVSIDDMHESRSSEPKDIRKITHEDLKKTLYSASLTSANQLLVKRTGRSASKISKHERAQASRGSKKATAASLHPITEDNLIESPTEKLLSTTNFDYDWLVKRDEKYAKITFKNGNVYEGEVADKLPHGKGTFWWADGTVYEGEFQDGAPTGRGRMQLPDLTEYTGSFYKGYFHGNGVYNIRTTNMVYTGGWKYGKKHGEGWLLYEPGVWYEGEFCNDLRNGNGFFHYSDKSCYEGNYVQNMRHGQGAMRWSNNDIYIGQWSGGTIEGYGEYSWKTDFNKTFSFPVQHHYKGSWVKGKRTGTGIMFFGTENGAKMAGVFHDNFKHGAAVVVCGNGRSIENNPLFQNDKPIHMSVSSEEIGNESCSAIFNQQVFQTIATTGISEKQWPSKEQQPQVATELLEYVNKEKGALCNPVEIQIHSSPDDIELGFYIEKALSMYINAFDTIQFDFDSVGSSFSSNASKIQLSKWNLMTLNSIQPSRIKSGFQDSPMVYGRCSVTQGNTPFNKTGSKFQSAMRSEEKYLKNVITRHLPKLMDIYYHYATITSPTKTYFKHYMIRMFLWQLYLDIGITKMGVSLVEIDQLLEENPASYVESCSHPFEHIYFFQFIQSLMGTALLLHYKSQEEVHSTEGLSPYILQKFLVEQLFVHAGSHQGRCLFEFKDVLPFKSVYGLYLKLGESHTARTFLNYVCTKKGEDPPCYKAWKGDEKPPKTQTLGFNANAVGHNFLYIPEKQEIGELPEEPVEEFEEIDPFFHDLSTFRVLGPKIVVKCLYTICPPILQNGIICNMDYPMTFLEFYEVLICCALLAIARAKKKKEFLRRIIAPEDFKTDDTIEQLDSSSRKGSVRIGRRKK